MQQEAWLEIARPQSEAELELCDCGQIWKWESVAPIRKAVRKGWMMNDGPLHLGGPLEIEI